MKVGLFIYPKLFVPKKGAFVGSVLKKLGFENIMNRNIKETSTSAFTVSISTAHSTQRELWLI